MRVKLTFIAAMADLVSALNFNESKSGHQSYVTDRQIVAQKGETGAAYVKFLGNVPPTSFVVNDFRYTITRVADGRLIIYKDVELKFCPEIDLDSISEYVLESVEDKANAELANDINASKSDDVPF